MQVEGRKIAWGRERLAVWPVARLLPSFGVESSACFAFRDRRYVSGMERLPDDLSELDAQTVLRARDHRDDRLTALFRRWPNLPRKELQEIRRVSDERQRLARYIGKLRARRSRAAREG